MTISKEKEVTQKENFYINTVDMKMIKIDPGTFIMGNDDEGSWDESPARKVNITQPFYISETQVTVEQFRQFCSECKPTEEHKPYMAGISWYDAVEFCDWLSKREGKPYRLPTEAEWEYVCKTRSSNSENSDDNENNQLGLKNMLSGVREWCYDWYGEYLHYEQNDPVGPNHGIAKVIRGGVLDRDSGKCVRSEFATPSNRAGIAPGFGHYPEDDNNQLGYHNIGFRVVQGKMPETKPYDIQLPFPQHGVKQNNAHIKQSPDTERPYFRKRYLLPAPPETKGYADRETIDAAGLHPAFRPHNHSPSLVVCPNGDLLYIVYTSYHEYEAGVSLIASRLRFGAEQWDMPDLQFDFPGANCHAPLLWCDNDTLYFFWGNPRLDNSFPFQWTTSDDNGASWSEVKFPYVKNKVGKISTKRQPINTVVRDFDGTMYVPCDGAGGASILWATDDNGKTWYDTIGRSGGRHTTYVLLKDGAILGMGGKSTDIDGYMPKSISYDGGRTWEISKTPFPAVGGGQRPSVLRLASGRLFMAGDFLGRKQVHPEGIPENGSYVALSEDEGKSWHIKQLYGAETARGDTDRITIGYSAARQAPNGIIHLITSLNRQALHFAMNEAWILDESANETDDKVIMKSSATSIPEVEEYSECYPDGQIKITWSGGIANDGRFLLHGPENWYYENGQKMREANYELGYKVGTETYWSKDGKKQWVWEYNKDGKDIWTQWWANGLKKSVSEWKNFKADGTAICWDRAGNVISQVEFKDGTIIS